MSVDRAVAELLDALAELDARRAQITAALDVLQIAPPAAPPPPAELPPAALPTCQTCGKVCASENGLRIHAARAHAPATSLPPVATSDPPAVIADDAMALRCEDCEFAAPVGPIRPLATHVLEAHGRHALLATERQPRTLVA